MHGLGEAEQTSKACPAAHQGALLAPKRQVPAGGWARMKTATILDPYYANKSIAVCHRRDSADDVRLPKYPEVSLSRSAQYLAVRRKPFCFNKNHLKQTAMKNRTREKKKLKPMAHPNMWVDNVIFVGFWKSEQNKVVK